jgi:TatD DNase family protein
VPFLIDTHCHLNHDRLKNDIEGAIERAQAAGVEQLLVVGYDWESSRQAVALSEQYPTTVFAAIGVHPHDSKEWNQEAEAWLLEIAQHPAVVAIGEIGLDFHYDFSPRPDQYLAFRQQMRLAKMTQLPVIIHCREAYPELLAVLAEPEFEEIRGVLHCWAGSPAEAEEAVKLGYYLGIGGTVTFKNAENVREAVRNAPLESIIVETDTPYLAPVPHRGKQNEPAYTRLVAEYIATLRNLPLSSFAAQTTTNAQTLFPKLLNHPVHS